jgi:uncharacterized integral membrane protein
VGLGGSLGFRIWFLLQFLLVCLPRLRSNGSNPDGSVVVEVVLVLVVLVLAVGNNDNFSITKVVGTPVSLPLGPYGVLVRVETVDYAARLANRIFLSRTARHRGRAWSLLRGKSLTALVAFTEGAPQNRSMELGVKRLKQLKRVQRVNFLSH